LERLGEEPLRAEIVYELSVQDSLLPGKIRLQSDRPSGFKRLYLAALASVFEGYRLQRLRKMRDGAGKTTSGA